jgi:hypothetical protein
VLLVDYYIQPNKSSCKFLILILIFDISTLCRVQIEPYETINPHRNPTLLYRQIWKTHFKTFSTLKMLSFSEISKVATSNVGNFFVLKLDIFWQNIFKFVLL